MTAGLNLKITLIPFMMFVLCGQAVLSQADFTAASIACKGENIVITNNSVNSTSFVWDFCNDALLKTPIVNQVTTAPGSIPVGLVLEYSNGNWYGFVSNREGTLIRLDFGNNLKSIPVPFDLGNFSMLSGPSDIDIYNENGTWYGLVTNYYGSNLVRLSFGNSLGNFPTAYNLGNLGSWNTLYGVDIVKSDNNLFCFVTSQGTNSISVINFGSSILNNPAAADVLTYTDPLLSSPLKIKLQQISTGWIGLVTCIGNNKVIKLDFGPDLLITPGFNSLADIPLPAGLDFKQDGNSFSAFVESQSGTLYRFTFGNTPSNPPIIENMGNYGLLGPTYGISLIKQWPNWSLFSIDVLSRSIVRFDFLDECAGQNSITSNAFEPTLVFQSSGEKSIELAAFDQIGNVTTKNSSINIEAKEAPSLAIFYEGLCVGHQVNFYATEVSGKSLKKFIWNFGDMSPTDANSTPSHLYLSAANYSVELKATDDMECSNSVVREIKIYNPPTSSFDLPSSLICTNNEFTFINTTTDNFDGNLTYEWLVNDIQKSTSRDLKYAFTSEGNQQIKLKTSIPGCSNELTQTLLNVQTGPVVGFSYIGKCEDETITFTNESAGSISGFQWNFGNGNTSVLEDPSEIYSTYGNYNVSLLTSGTNGCVSTLTKPVNIYSVPQTNFSLDLPPFACSGSLSQFNDLTPSMPDSNISSWAWSFGDPSNGTSSQKNPLYTYSLSGDYSVALSTTSNFGCSNSIQKTVTIYPSPKANFSFGPACVNQGTQFTDASTGDIKLWSWTIQSTTYSSKNQVHIFKSAATHNALLTVTGTNNCISQISKNVHVPVPVVSDFTASATCATKPALFDEISKGGADPAASWTWDFDGQVSSTEVSPIQYTFPSTGIKSVTMHSTRKSGCTYSVTQDISIEEPPRAKFTVFLESGAAPFTLDLTNQSTKATKYLWKPGDPKQSNSTLYSPSFTYTELGDYMIELEASNELGCKDQVQQLIYVVVPQINAAVSNFKLEKILGSDSWKSVVTIENKSNVALIDPDIYLDISGNALIKEKIIGVIKPSTSLTYTFTPSILPRAVDYACAEIKISSDEYQFDNRQCMNVADQFTSMTPYPNPADDELILEWINISSEPMDVIIYNVSGQEIISRQYSPTLKGLNQVKVDVSNLQVGIYFVSYSVDGQTQNFKFSVVR